MDYKLVTIVLAAGASRRMGTSKLFLPLFGSTLLRLAVTAALDRSREGKVIVVTGAYNQEIRKHLMGDDRIVFVHNPDWASGMASSLLTGVRAAAALTPTHYFITLADQPTMGAENLSLLTEESRLYPDQIIATHYPERKGVPAIFPARFSSKLAGQEGSFGARKLIKLEGDQVRTITFKRPPVDVDTPEDYEALLRQ